MTTAAPQSGRIDVSSLLTDPAAYSAIRAERRAEIIPIRDARKVSLGDLVSLDFENATTLTFQTQEMVFVERLSTPEELEHEVAAYSRMLPTSTSLVATFFIYIRDAEGIKAQLQELQGLHQSVSIEVGAHVVTGVPIPPSDEEDDSQTVSVHVLRFSFDEAALAAFRDPSIPATVVIDHPRYSDDVTVREGLRHLLIGDLEAASE